MCNSVIGIQHINTAQEQQQLQKQRILCIICTSNFETRLGEKSAFYIGIKTVNVHI